MRIIAGALAGRRLVAPRGLATRPTSDRVREALFSVLASVAGAAVLDLYAGTGALGLEALSRGAARAAFVEDDRHALEALRANVGSLGVGNAALVYALRVERAAQVLLRAGPFDLVFADPPYADLGAAAAALTALVPALAPEARLVLEHARRDPSPTIAGVELVAQRGWGDTAVSIYSLQEAAPCQEADLR